MNSSWRDSIIQQLNARNKLQNYGFQDLIACHNRTFESTTALRRENFQLSLKIEQLRQESSEDRLHKVLPADRKSINDTIQNLEHKLLIKQDELTELLRIQEENTQAFVELNCKLNEKEKLLSMRDHGRMEAAEWEQKLHASDARCQELMNSNVTLKDEYNALHLAFEAVQEKLRKAQEENVVLVDKLIKLKAKDAEKLNEENENFLRIKHAKVAQELKEAAKDMEALSFNRPAMKEMTGALIPCYGTAMPQRIVHKFDAHDGEVNAVRWSPGGRIIATGGVDCKVKLWDIGKGMCESHGTLVGSNAAVTSVDIDSTGEFLVGASNDFASRVWKINKLRLLHTFTGHCGKVLTAKFLAHQSDRVVTGSYDRTLKIWDLRESKFCVETKFPGSSCNDVVTSENFTFISGHFDKKIRFWDARSEGSSGSSGTVAKDIVLQGKITSLDVSKDSNYLLACVRDDTLRMFDLRMKQEVSSFSADNFKVGCDWTRAMFSPNSELVCVGSADGGVFVWSALNGRLVCESSHREHGSTVTAIAWHPCGGFLASVDKGKKAIIWTGE